MQFYALDQLHNIVVIKQIEKWRSSLCTDQYIILNWSKDLLSFLVADNNYFSLESDLHIASQ